jgi:hypothetical protein
MPRTIRYSIIRAVKTQMGGGGMGPVPIVLIFFGLCTNLQSIRFKKCGPQTFRVGELVEIQLSFVGVLLKEKHRKVLIVLRSMALLDGQFSIVR